MNWQAILEDLNRAGWTQIQIAERCGVRQSTVSDLARGRSKSPSFDFGMSLQALHREVVPHGRVDGAALQTGEPRAGAAAVEKTEA